jgi:hypothetical protein
LNPALVAYGASKRPSKLILIRFESATICGAVVIVRFKGILFPNMEISKV